jgi:hypothetical protein
VLSKVSWDTKCSREQNDLESKVFIRLRIHSFLVTFITDILSILRLDDRKDVNIWFCFINFHLCAGPLQDLHKISLTRTLERYLCRIRNGQMRNSFNQVKTFSAEVS